MEKSRDAVREIGVNEEKEKKGDEGEARKSVQQLRNMGTKRLCLPRSQPYLPKLHSALLQCLDKATLRMEQLDVIPSSERFEVEDHVGER